MRFDVYQERAYETAVYPWEVKVLYPALLLSEEAGEVIGKISKLMRVQGSEWRDTALGDPNTRGDLIKEMGDVLWALSALAEDLGMDLSEVAEENLRKLAARKARGTIAGSGDNR